MKERFIIVRIFENGQCEYLWSTQSWTTRKYAAGRLETYEDCKNLIEKQSSLLKCIYQIEKIFVL